MPASMLIKGFANTAAVLKSRNRRGTQVLTLHFVLTPTCIAATEVAILSCYAIEFITA